MKAQLSEGPKNERTELNSNLDGSHEGKTPKRRAATTAVTVARTDKGKLKR